MTQAPRVSVIMQVFGVIDEDYLQESIESVLSQTFEDFELIIVTDSATNSRCLSAIKSYRDARIHHIPDMTKVGTRDLYNIGLKLARGDYVGLVDADDVTAPEWLERLVHFLDDNPEVGAVGTGFEVIDEKGKPLFTHRHPIDPALIRWELLFHCVIMNALVRRTIYDRLDGYDSRFLVAGDYEFWTRAALVTRLANVPDILYQYRRHHRNVTLNRELRVRNTTMISQKAIASVYGRAIPWSLALALAQPRYVTRARDALDASSILCDLCLRHVSPQIPSRESLLIRYNAARRLVRLALVSATKNPMFSLMILLRIPRLTREGSLGFVVSLSLTGRQYFHERWKMRSLNRDPVRS